MTVGDTSTVSCGFSKPVLLGGTCLNGMANRFAKPRHRIFGTFRLFDQLHEGFLHEVFGSEKPHMIAFVSVVYSL